MVSDYNLDTLLGPTVDFGKVEILENTRPKSLKIMTPSSIFFSKLFSKNPDNGSLNTSFYGPLELKKLISSRIWPQNTNFPNFDGKGGTAWVTA